MTTTADSFHPRISNSTRSRAEKKIILPNLVFTLSFIFGSYVVPITLNSRTYLVSSVVTQKQPQLITLVCKERRNCRLDKKHLTLNKDIGKEYGTKLS